MPKSLTIKSKVRFDGLDVAAMVQSLSPDLVGRRIVNIYDGVSDQDSFLLKFDGADKPLLFLESGIRFHTTQHASLLQAQGMPSPFCSKLRKHLRGLRLEALQQLGHYDRVVLLHFGTGETRHSLILELYARGNLILLNAAVEILALLRSHDYDDQVAVQVGQVYPVTYATSHTPQDGWLTMTSAQQAMDWTRLQLQLPVDDTTTSGDNQRKPIVLPLKALLLKPSSGVHHYGPSLLEHCILMAHLNPNTRVGTHNLDTVLQPDQWQHLITSLQTQGQQRLDHLGTTQEGFILYQPREDGPHVNETPGGLNHVDKILLQFQPHLLQQHQGQPCIPYPTFALAVDDFYAHLSGQKQTLRAQAAQAAAQRKLDKIQQDQEQRVVDLQQEQELLQRHAQLVEWHAANVDKALTVVNAALDTGMDWEALQQLVHVEQERNNPIALLIDKLALERDEMTLRLPDPDSDETVHVTISLQQSAHGNARDMFAKYRAYKDKSQKTIQASTKALRAAEANAQKQLAQAQLKARLTTNIHATRKPHWFEKFHFFVTSDNYLVLGGRDAHQNELLVKRYLRPGDAYLHADVHGAASCVLRAKRRRVGSTTQPLPLSEQALREAGHFTICRSSAWTSKMITSAWWVESHQVSKTAPTGEYLTVGSFMIRGKKNFLPPSPLEMGLAVLFRLGDEDSIARHKNDRRDFSLLMEEDEEVGENRLEYKIENIAWDKGEPSDVPDDKEEKPVDADEHQEEAEENEPVADEKSDEKYQVKIEKKKEEQTVDDADKEVEEEKEEESKKKKGRSVRERKLIKKYGSLEAAEEAVADREATEQKAREDAAVLSRASSAVSDESSKAHTHSKRGKRGKLKKAARRYADQDDEDKELALLVLHGGEKKAKEKNGTKEPRSEVQNKAAEETKALLVKDAEGVADSLDDEVKAILATCVTVKASDGNGSDHIRWDKFDGDVLEQLKTLKSRDEQVVVATRLLQLKQSTRVDNFSASLAGIIRTVKRFGHVTLDDSEAADTLRRKTNTEKQKEREEWKETLAAEGIVEDEIDDDGIDDTTELSKLTGKPLADDSLLYAVPVCAPYQTLSQYRYRVKLTPGNLKRGKAAKQCFDMFFQGNAEKTPHNERLRDLIKRVNDNDWVQVICPDVKISAPGVSKNTKNSKRNAKGKKN